MKSSHALEELLEYRFRDEKLLQLALTHPSVSHESPGAVAHNQRLEFLGDAVLGLILTRELFEKFPHLGEGPLTKARAQMVNRRTLAEQARHFNLGACLMMSRGEELSGGRSRSSALADAFEAVVGAIFLDGGYDVAAEFILRSFRDAFGQLTEVPNLDNPKGELQELLQAASTEPPQYEVTASSGPDHDRLFQCAVYHRGVELGRGQGKSKKEAEGQAALTALEGLRSKPGNSDAK
ncbi:MAG TPA: ribonuclease III [Verrucomicrobiae bacterium]|nr:ribonuclease III [Verrucomicrobiae bacterium]